MKGQRASVHGKQSISNSSGVGLSTVEATLQKLAADEKRHEVLIQDIASKLAIRREGARRIHERHKDLSFADSNYVWVKSIGKGRHGEMKVAKRKNNAYVKRPLGMPTEKREQEAVSRFVAIRIIRRYSVRSTARRQTSDVDDISTGPDQQAMLRHCQALRDLDHPNIQREIETFQDSQNLYIVMELYTGGDMISRDKDPLPEPRAAWSIKQICSAMAHAHGKGIVHQDLRPDNVLYASKDADARLVVTDWACIEYIGTPEKDARKGLIKTKFSAPELVPSSRTDRGDVWSIGVMAYALLTFELPFGWNGEGTLQFKGNLSENCVDFISKALSINPQDRLPAIQMLSHPWLQQVNLANFSGDNLTREVSSVIDLNVANSLARYRERSVLQRTAAVLAVEHLSGEKLHELTQLFQKLDKNGDGVVSREELMTGLTETLKRAQAQDGPCTPSGKNFGQEEADTLDLEDLIEDSDKVLALVTLMDPDSDGKIAYTDFLAAAAESCFDNCVDLCWEAFSAFDLDKNGTITRAELSVLLDSPMINDVIESAAKQGLASPKTKADFHTAFAVLGGSIQNIDGMMTEVDRDADGRITFEEFMKFMMEG